LGIGPNPQSPIPKPQYYNKISMRRNPNFSDFIEELNINK
jgi:hypothetical protein